MMSTTGSSNIFTIALEKLRVLRFSLPVIIKTLARLFTRKAFDTVETEAV
ncbi:hypothetical protein V3C99_007286, partial [Haemonchus contortus]